MEQKSTFGGAGATYGQTQVAAQAVKEGKKQLFIGIPHESTFQERRVALTPESVALLVNNGHRVVIETNAGLEASFADQAYSEAGAKIAYDTKEVFEADIICKVAPPTEKEVDMFHTHQIVFSPLHLPTLKDEYIEKLSNKKVTAIAYEYIKDEAGTFPVVRALSEIAGSAALLIASSYLSSNYEHGQGVLLGGISSVPPSKVVVLGAGVVGEFVTKAALGLGAEVRVFDNSMYKLMRLQNNVNARVYTSAIYPDLLAEELATADVAVGAIHSEEGRAPVIVTESMVSKMKDGAFIIDVSIDQGGCFETSEVTTHNKPTFIKYGVIHYCVPNIASRFAKTASYTLSNVLGPSLLAIQEYGTFDSMLHFLPGVRHGVYLYKGTLTNRHLSERFQMKYTNLDLLMASSM